jgi:hypothetical protein
VPCRESQPDGSPTWSYGVTTCKDRLNTYLPNTLAALAAAGFDRPLVFADGVTHPDAAALEDRLGLPVGSRHPALRIHGNWVLSAYELYLRDPFAKFYAVFQDDFTCVKNLRAYLERCWPAHNGGRVYLNLLSWRDNERVVGKNPVLGWHEGAPRSGKPYCEGQALQCGRGAVALVFDNAGLRALLSHQHLVDRACGSDPARRWRNVDGGIVETMNKQCYREMVHNPSLVQHEGHESTIYLPQEGRRGVRRAGTYRPDFDPLSLLPKEAAG